MWRCTNFRKSSRKTLVFWGVREWESWDSSENLRRREPYTLHLCNMVPSHISLLSTGCSWKSSSMKTMLRKKSKNRKQTNKNDTQMIFPLSFLEIMMSRGKGEDWKRRGRAIKTLVVVTMVVAVAMAVGMAAVAGMMMIIKKSCSYIDRMTSNISFCPDW